MLWIQCNSISLSIIDIIVDRSSLANGANNSCIEGADVGGEYCAKTAYLSSTINAF